MWTFQDCLDSMEEQEVPSILLGNGFSQAWDSTIFNYANLLEQADFGDSDNVMRSLFQEMETFDFEVIMKQLVAAEKVLNVYGSNDELIEKIQSDQSILKEALITAISNTHPDLPNNIRDDQYIAVRSFLSQFNEVFTLNYDLLFYWARNKSNLEPRYYNTDDGFRAAQCWDGHNTEQNAHFLHGGLHIFDSGTDIKKHTYTENGSTIIEKVRNNLDRGRFPLFVSEPSYNKKKNRIEHNPYLNYCFQSLRKLRGTLFIYGHSFDENDKHIFDQIKASRVNKIFVSIFGDEDSQDNTRTKANALTYLGHGQTEVVFYQAESTNVWE